MIEENRRKNIEKMKKKEIKEEKRRKEKEKEILEKKEREREKMLEKKRKEEEMIKEEYKIPFFEASAKSGENVDEVFKALYKKISEVYGDLEREKGSKLNKKNKNKGICCI